MKLQSLSIALIISVFAGSLADIWRIAPIYPAVAQSKNNIESPQERKDRAMSYYYTGLVKVVFENYKDAIVEYDNAIRLDPQLDEAYAARGVAKFLLSDKKGTLIDFDNAIRINPQFADAYWLRGMFKDELGDKKGALVDLDNAIRLNPQLAAAYFNRGSVKYKLNDIKGARTDLNTAAQLFNTQKNRVRYEETMELIRKI